MLKQLTDAPYRIDALGDLTRCVIRFAHHKDAIGFFVTAQGLAAVMEQLSVRERQMILPKWREAVDLVISFGLPPQGVTFPLVQYIESGSDLRLVTLLLRSAVILERTAPEALTDLSRLMRAIEQHQTGDLLIENLMNTTKSPFAGKRTRLHDQIRDVATHGIARTLVETRTPEALRAAALAYQELYGAGGVRSLDATVIPCLETVLDLFHGFGSWAWEARRGPTREPALLAQFGQELGKLHYVNAKEIDRFPGRGFLISGLNPERIFNSDPEYAAYRSAWPALGPLIPTLSQCEFVMTRGFVAVYEDSPATKVRLTADFTLNYALVICNDHFRNPGAIEGYIVDRSMLREALEGTLIAGDDTTGGWSPALKDIAASSFTHEQLLEASKSGWFHCVRLNVGSAPVVGISAAFAPGLEEEYRQAHAAYEQVLQGVRARRENRFSASAGPQYGGEMLFMDHDESRTLYNLHAEMMRAHERLEARRSQSMLDEAHVRRIVEHYDKRLDLFRLSYALWKKGQTYSHRYVGERASGEPQPSDSNPPPAERKFVVASAEESALNPESTRMLSLAYGYHQQLLAGVQDSARFPIIASAPTLRSRAAPNGTFWLDTFTMSGELEGKRFQLNARVGSPEMDDVLFWWTQVMPCVAGTSTDLRVYSRDVLPGLQEKKV